MFKMADSWYAEFPPTPGVAFQLGPDKAIVTAASLATGQHALLFLERIVPGSSDAESWKMDLSTWLNAEKSALPGVLQNVGAVIGITDATIRINKSVEKNTSRPFGSSSKRYTYRSWVISDSQAAAVILAADRFSAKNGDGAGRYRYRLPGGLVGRIFSKPGTRGINCVDFVVKVLNEVGIAFGNSILNTPGLVAQ